MGEDPTIVGISIPYNTLHGEDVALRGGYVFQMDTTYKFDQSGYSDLVIDVTN